MRRPAAASRTAAVSGARLRGRSMRGSYTCTVGVRDGLREIPCCGGPRDATAENSQAWRGTLPFTGPALVLGFAVPFVVALVTNEFRHAQAYLRLLMYLPVLVPPVASVLLFKYLYDPGDGLFDGALGALGLPGQPWLQDPDAAVLSAVVAATRMNTPG